MALFEQTRAVTEQAIARAPHDSRLWLLLAANYFRFDWLNERASASLKMSYYTGSNTIAVLPHVFYWRFKVMRLKMTIFRNSFATIFELLLTRKAELMPAIVAAYNTASPSGRQFIEKTLGELDPSMLAAIRSKAEDR